MYCVGSTQSFLEQYWAKRIPDVKYRDAASNDVSQHWQNFQFCISHLYCEISKAFG